MKKEIKFNSFYSSNNYTKNLEKLFADYDLFRQKYFSNQCINVLQKTYIDSDLLLTHSATGALEMIALALDIKEGDEIILPSYTFVSTANPFVLRGAKLIFIDIELDTFGIDPEIVKQAITPKTKAIVAMHYAGHACKIDELKEIANEHDLFLIEDAATALGANHNDQPLGSFGDFSIVSFDVTKHISASQGGLLIINNKRYTEKLHSIYHVGTNRNAFENGDVPYYEWTSLGSKYQMPETNAAILLEQIENQEDIINKRIEISKTYYKQLIKIKDLQLIESERINCNFHEFYILCENQIKRDSLSAYLKDNNIESLFHYIPLHQSKFGKQIGEYKGGENTKNISERLLRLPLHSFIEDTDVELICSIIIKHFKQ